MCASDVDFVPPMMMMMMDCGAKVEHYQRLQQQEGLDTTASSNQRPLHDEIFDSTPAPTRVMALPPALADIYSRRSISDSVLSRSQWKRLTYQNKDIISVMSQRSGGKMVQHLVAAMQESCDRKERQLEEEEDCIESEQVQVEEEAPERECCVLAYWATDSYYQVVIAGKGGIPALVRAMRLFPDARGLQECACLTLANLCLHHTNPSNLEAIRQVGGVGSVLSAMTLHPRSEAVQTAAIDALRNMSSLLLLSRTTTTSATPAKPIMSTENFPISNLVHILSNAKSICLRPVHQSITENLMAVLEQV